MQLSIHVRLAPGLQISSVSAAIHVWQTGGGGTSRQGARTEEGVARWIKLPGKGLP